MKLFSKKGCYVFIANANRNLNIHFKTPKDNIFRIGGLPYVTNPDKVESLNEAMYAEVYKGIEKKKANFKARIDFFKGKINELGEQIKKLESPKDDIQVNQLKLQIKDFEGKISTITKKMNDREQVYYYQKRASFFYIEGDPVPKDFYEWYTHLDSEMIDNIMARCLIKDPKTSADLQAWLKKNQMFIYIIMGVLALVAIICFRNQTALEQIAAQAGVTIQL